MNKDLFIRALEEICPPELGESWDNCGFQINSGSEFTQHVLTALEVTGEVIDEAVQIDADMIVTHHPLIFGGITSVDNNSVIGNYLVRLIKAGIDVYSCHTNFDKVSGGNNDYLGKVLKMMEITGFDCGGEAAEFCRKGILPSEMTLAEFADFTAECLEIDRNQLRFVGNPERKIRTAGWCTGAGMEFLKDAAKEGCDVYITGDAKYHDAQEASELGLAVIDAGHYGTEKIFAENMAALLKAKVEDDDIFDGRLDITVSKKEVNPFK